MATVHNIDAVFSARTGNFERGISNVQRGLRTVGTVAAGAAAAAGVALVGMGAKGVTAFAELETGMNEVFTLLPGISDKAMTDMTDDVQAFATEMGTTTDKVVPALYQSLSAGVPAGGVFDFMEQAQKLSVGGITDLTTAVDGLTSATNAYGPEVLSATEASDSMFTAMRLGKTTIEELAQNVSKTAPLAASLGVSFDEVNAAIAAMTAQGEPTSEAATKIRGALSELGKAGSAAYDQFQAIANESFPEFIAGGGTFQEALQMMADTADMSGGRITDSFGSIEAGMAAQMLTSDTGAAAMEANMQAMQNAAGATDAAYAQMDQGLGRSWERIKANAQVLFTEVGERLAPTFQDGADAVLAIMPTVADAVVKTFEAIGDAINFVRDDVMPAITSTWEAFQSDSDSVFSSVGTVVEGSIALVVAAFDVVETAWTNVLKPVFDAIQPLVEGVFKAIGTVITTQIEVATKVLEGIAKFLDGDLTGAFEAFGDAGEAAMNGLSDAVKFIMEGLQGTLERIWNAVLGTLERIANSIADGVTGAFDRLASGVAGAFEDMWNGAKDFAGRLLTDVTQAFRDLVTNVGDAFGGFLDVVKAPLNDAIDLVNGFIDHFNAMEIRIPEFQIPSITIPNPLPGDNDFRIGGQTFGGQTFSVPDLPRIPHLASGGIVDDATLAMIGEAGPEAVVPLGRGGGFGNQTIILELDGREIARSMVKNMPAQLRLRGA